MPGESLKFIIQAKKVGRFADFCREEDLDGWRQMAAVAKTPGPARPNEPSWRGSLLLSCRTGDEPSHSNKKTFL
jgi:hypothetical protein